MNTKSNFSMLITITLLILVYSMSHSPNVVGENHIAGTTNLKLDQSLTPSLLWNHTIVGEDIGNSPVVADMDGDGFIEIAISGYGYLAVLNHDGTVLWENTTLNGELSETPLTLGDVDNDGKLEILFADYSDQIFALNAEDGSELWRIETEDPPSIGITIADINRDGQLEVLASGGVFMVIDGKNGIVLWEYDVGTVPTIQPAVADFDGDGMLEIVSGGVEGNLTLFDTNGDIMWQHRAARQAGEPVILDVNLDGILDVVMGDEDGHLRAINGTGGDIIWETGILGAIWISSPSVADIDNNGRYELIFSSWIPGNSTYVIDAMTGNLVWSLDTDDIGTRAPVIADLTSDPGKEILFSMYLRGEILVLSSSGAVLLRYDYSEYGSFGHPVLYDINNDGNLELITTGTSAEFVTNLMVFSLGSTESTEIFWQGGSGGSDFMRHNNIQFRDTDSDTLSDTEEGVLGTNPNNPDTDGDGINDGEENVSGSNPLIASGTTSEDTETTDEDTSDGNFIDELPGFGFLVGTAGIIALFWLNKQKRRYNTL